MNDVFKLTFLALAVVGVSSQPVVELLLVAVEAGAAPGQAVHLAGHVGVLHVAALGVEVGHVPAILLVIVVVGVGAEKKDEGFLFWNLWEER